MKTDWLPKSNSGLLQWSANFRDIASGLETDIGLDSAQCTAYGLLHDDYAAKLAIAEAPTTRTRGTIIAMQEAKKHLMDEARRLVRIVQAYPLVTNQQRADLAIRVRDSEPTNLNPPGLPPAVTVERVMGRQVRLRVRDAAEPESRAIAPNSDGADIYTFVGESPPAFGDAAWLYHGRATRTIATVIMDNSVPGGVKVWFAAHWVNRRGRGPTCEPVSTYVQAGPAGMAEAS